MCSKYHLVSLLNEKQRSTFANFWHLFIHVTLLTHSALSRIRVVLDFRRTNESLLQTWTSQPLPLIEELLANMHHMKVISTADLSQGFFGCKLHPEKGQQYTAFEHEGRLYQWT